jgi:hypothetical protein
MAASESASVPSNVGISLAPKVNRNLSYSKGEANAFRSNGRGVLPGYVRRLSGMRRIDCRPRSMIFRFISSIFFVRKLLLLELLMGETLDLHAFYGC